MANAEQVKQLTQGIAKWNQWRNNNLIMGVDLSKADLHKTNLAEADLHGVDLSGADLSGVNLRRAVLANANLHGANLHGANLHYADLFGADLSNTDLHGATLISASLRGADLRGADLRVANLNKAGLSRASLYGADLRKVRLIGTDLHEADLSGTDLYGVEMIGADLSEAILSGTNLDEATMGYTIIAQVDLRTTKGLATIRHTARSYIELFSVQLPQDGSAQHFLRGVGVPNEWIDLWHAKLINPIQYYSCFISYSNMDEGLAKRLHADLQAEGVRCWFAPEDIKIGDQIHQRIDEAIHLQDKLLLLLSEHSIASTWVANEVEAAIEKEQRQKRDVLFPVRLDESIMQATQAWATKLRRTRHIGDFCGWKHQPAYQEAFQRLLRDLKRS